MNNEKRTQKAWVDVLTKRVDNFLIKNPDWKINADYFYIEGECCLFGASYTDVVNKHLYIDEISKKLNLTPIETSSIEAGFRNAESLLTSNSIDIDWEDKYDIDDFYYAVGQKCFSRLQKKYGEGKVIRPY